MRLVIFESAVRDLEEIFRYIAKDNPAAARGTVLIVLGRMRALTQTGFVNIGRRGRVAGTRELVEAPYIIVYKVDDEMRPKVVTLVAVMHGARER
jgi:toxin ParE1/3/4